MSAREVLLRPLDAAGLAVSNLGEPRAARDATYTDTTSLPAPVGRLAAPGSSLLAAPADHQHASEAPMRIVAFGKTTIAAGARVTLATFRRGPKELFPPGGFAYVRDDRDGITWENEVEGADHLATYHERTAVPGEVRFRAVNESNTARTLEWATVGLTVPGA